MIALLLLRMDTNIALAGWLWHDSAHWGRMYVGSMTLLLAVETLPREVCLDPRFLYNFTAPRFGILLANLLQGSENTFLGEVFPAFCLQRRYGNTYFGTFEFANSIVCAELPAPGIVLIRAFSGGSAAPGRTHNSR